jgi:2-polyprenyl-3-methyl-5-hydroxy-6-metoxy-1,4-benzoquinol methylase
MKNGISPIVDRKEWFSHWFDSAFYHKLYAHRDEKEAAGFIDRLMGWLEPPLSTTMLDLGCGNGRHSKYLAAKGFNVTGMDLASSSIREAKKSGTASLHFYRHDMREFFGKKCFDYIFNFFTSFGYFKTDDEDRQVVRNISTALKPDGTLVVDYINSTYAVARLVAKEEKEIDGIRYHIDRWTDSTHFFKKITITDMLFGEPLEYIERVRKFTVGDFDRLFTENGLQLTNVFGDYQLSKYDPHSSPRIILIAQKTKHEQKEQ